MDNWLIFTITCVFFFNGGETVNGLKNAKKGEYAFMAYLYYPNEKSEWRRFLEAAILITPEWLVSSAVDLEYSGAGTPTKQLTARMGAVIIDSKLEPQDDDEQERQIFEVVKSREDWWKREINLLRTAIPFEITDSVQPVPITTAKVDMEGRMCHVLVYSQLLQQRANNSEDKHLIQFPVTILESDMETCGKNFDQQAMTCGHYVENVTSIIDPDFCQDNSGGPLICDGEVTGLQSYADNDDCKPPYLYQMFWAWGQFISCGTNDCEGECDAICSSKYKDEINENQKTSIMSNTSSENTSNGHSSEKLSEVLIKPSLTVENNSQSNVEVSSEKNIVHKEDDQKNTETLINQKMEQEHETKEQGNITLEKDHVPINSNYLSPKEVNFTEAENKVFSSTNENVKNEIAHKNNYISLEKSNNTQEKSINMYINDDAQKDEVHSLSSKDELQEDKSKSGPYQSPIEKELTMNANTYIHQHNSASEENQDASENESLSKEEKKQEVIKEEDDTVPESTNNTEENKDKIENNISENSNNNTEHEQDLTEKEVIKPNNEVETTNEVNEENISDETKNKNENVSTISRLSIKDKEKEIYNDNNEANNSVKDPSENENGTTETEKHNELHNLEGQNDEKPVKEMKTKSENQDDNIENESIVSVQENKLPKAEIPQNEVDSKPGNSDKSSDSQNDGHHEDDNSKEKSSSTASNDNTKVRIPNTSEQLKPSNKDEYSNHSTEPNESHSNHIIMEVTSVVIKTVEDLLYSRRNSSRQYGPRTTINLNVTEELLTPKPKFGKMGRTMADQAGSRTQHTILHCLFMGTVFDLLFVVLF